MYVETITCAPQHPYREAVGIQIFILTAFGNSHLPEPHQMTEKRSHEEVKTYIFDAKANCNVLLQYISPHPMPH